MKIVFENNRWSFCDVNGTGWINLGFELNGKSCSSSNVDENENGLDVTGYANGWQEDIKFRYGRFPGSMILERWIVNNSSEPLELTSVADSIIDGMGKIVFPDIHEYTIRYMHTSNMRTEKYPSSRPEYPYIRPVPYHPVRINEGEGNDFPAVVFFAEKNIVGNSDSSRILLVEGDLDQTRFTRSWELGLDGDGPGIMRTFRGYQQHLQSAPYVIAPGEKVRVSHVFYQIRLDDEVQNAYADYVASLCDYHSFYGEKSPMRHGAVYCTWNFGIFQNINEVLLEERVHALKERVPECTHFLIDAGYHRIASAAGTLDTFYPDPAEGYNPELFPNGMAHMGNIIRQTGLIPCIWLSPKVMHDSELACNHPDWLLRDAEGNADLIGNSTFLDISVPGAMEFLLRIFDTLFLNWGYRGLKFDFMTQWFTLERARFRNGGSGNIWRDRVFKEIRSRIGEDGLFMTCIAMSMGNPFPGLNADCYRCGCDIHMCTWPEQVKACKATLPQILFEGRRTFLLNMDSAGFGDVPENEQMFRLTWVFITQGILELGGAVERLPEEQIRLFRKLCAYADRGHRVRCPDDRALTGDGMPEILRVDYPEDSISFQRGIRSHIAFFNWGEYGKPIGGEISYLGIESCCQISNFWTGVPVQPDKGILMEFLTPRSARLFEISG